jgi:hypothetical protein
MVSDCASKQVQPHLEYVAFDEGPVYAILRSPLRLRVRSNLIGHIRDTVIFREKMFDWVSTYLL